MLRHGGGDQGGGEPLVESEEESHALPVVRERLGPVAAVRGVVQFLVEMRGRAWTSYLGSGNQRTLYNRSLGS